MSETIARVLALDVPIVVMDPSGTSPSARGGMSISSPANAEAIAQAGADYLKRKGFGHFAYICDKQGSEWALETQSFFQNCLERDSRELRVVHAQTQSEAHDRERHGVRNRIG
jgi:DNA-binding LacI/PurR family transcriptional regulator